MVIDAGGYHATAESVAQHHAPQWWQDAKFGILVTWGPYSVPAFAQPTDSFFAFAEWYWFYQQLAPGELTLAMPSMLSADAETSDTVYRDYHRAVYGDEVTYDDLIDRWRAEAWDPAGWIELFEQAGARYFVMVAKHHDGVALWPTATTDRNSVAIGPGRDIVGDLMEAADGSSLRSGLFYAMAEWFTTAPRPDRIADVNDPLFDLAFNRQRQARNAYTGAAKPYRGYRDIGDYATGHVIPQIEELVERYHPSILWFDLPGDADYYQANRLIADFYNSSALNHPDGVVVNDRAALGAHGDFHTYEYGHHPSSAESSEPFEACRSIGTSFGYNAIEDEAHYSDAAALIATLVEVVSDGGNLLLNVGPRADGTIDPRQAARLLQIGRWLDTNGEAIYGSRPWSRSTVGDVRFTVGADGVLYAFVPPSSARELVVDVPVALAAGTNVELLGHPGRLEWVTRAGHTRVSIPETGITTTDLGAPFVLRLGVESPPPTSED